MNPHEEKAESPMAIEFKGASGDTVTLGISDQHKNDLVTFLNYMLDTKSPDTPIDIIQDAGVFPEDLQDIIGRIEAQQTPGNLVLSKQDVLSINRLISEHHWMQQPPEQTGIDQETYETIRTDMRSVYEQAYA